MNKFTVIALSGVVAVGCFFRFNDLGSRCLWLDEAIAWRLSTYPPIDLIERMRQPFEGSPPLYNLLLSAWMAVAGDSETALRMPAAVAGVLSILGLFALARQVVRIDPSLPDGRREAAGSAIPIVAAAVMALSIPQIFNARQVRMYSLGVALLTWSSWALLKAIWSDGSSRKGWLVYVALAVASCYTHALALLTIISHAIFALVVYTNRWTRLIPGKVPGAAPLAGSSTTAGWVPACFAFLAVAVGFLPWVSVFQSKVDESGRSYWMPSPKIDDAFAQMFETFAGPGVSTAGFSWWGGLALSLILLIAIIDAVARRKVVGVYFLIMASVPLEGIALHATMSGKSLFQSRYLSFVFVDWSLVIVLLVMGLPPLARRTCLAVVASSWVVLMSSSGWNLIGPRAEPGARAAIQSVQARRGRDEPVLMRSATMFFVASYYARGKFDVHLVSESSDRGSHFLSLYLSDGDLMTWNESVQASPRFWWLSSDTYDDERGFLKARPRGWSVQDAEPFNRDLFWEKPILVEHVGRDNQAAAGATPIRRW